ncbi:MAG: FAD-binding oxidoreductase, partial [Sphingobacteriales bacterium]
TFSYWEKKHFFKFDIIIIGSGIVGLSAAISIKEKQPLLSVAILESGFLPTGASTKNAGFACFGSISELIEQEKLCGSDGLHALITRRWSGLQKLRGLIGDANLGFKNNGGYELFRAEEATLSQLCVSKLGHFNHLIKDIVNEEPFNVADHKIPVLGLENVAALIENKLESQIDTGLMMRSLLLKAGNNGITIFNSCNVKSFIEGNNGQEVHTEMGVFYCKKLVLCTNAFTARLLPEIKIVPGRGQVVLTSPIPGLKLSGTFHYQKGFYYFRDIDGRVLLGGGRELDMKAEETTVFGETKIVQDALLNLLNEVIIPGKKFNIDHRWSGIMAFGPDLEPTIEEVRPDIFCAARCNGMGVAIGCQTGEDIAMMAINSL